MTQKTTTPLLPPSQASAFRSEGSPVNGTKPDNGDVDALETQDWLDSLDYVLQSEGPERAAFLLSQLKNKALDSGAVLPFTANTSYINTIPVSKQPPFPGNRDLERRIKSLIRWTAMAM